jgi:hypothetical protein
MHPPNPPTNKAACQGRLVRNSDIQSNSDNATDRDALQANRIARLYADTFATASTIARLAYGVVP